MRKHHIIIILILSFSLSDSYSQQQNNETWRNLIGCWVNHTNFGFELIHIHSIDSVIVYNFLDREKEMGETDSTLKYSFYTSEGLIRPSESPYHFSIQTKKYRYDYFLNGHRLVEYGKAGEEKEFVRFK